MLKKFLYSVSKPSKAAEVRWGEDQHGRKVVNRHLILG